MSKLSKAQAKAHAEATALLSKDVLSQDERAFVLQNWQESANHVNTTAGAFFTPIELAGDFSLDVGPGRLVDLCAGIGTLSRAVIDLQRYSDRPEIVCVEVNPAYVEVGRKIVPEATWICADLFDVFDMGLGRFDVAISNPPFGRIKREGGRKAPRYTGADFEFHVIDIAAHLADYGVFILPQMSAGFSYSGRPFYERQTSGKAFDFQRVMGLHFEAAIGIDCSVYRDQWHGVAPAVEVVSVDFSAQDAEVSTTSEKTARGDTQFDMFEAAA
ncbi:methyltransferase [Aurantimonas coralicida]|uniref:methyltransferase n=1 Tax=Aurantimonas coralicida TaxID=182270 RepID=UPI001E425FD2|nr:methyltransferase [Aurantimonas coralicida]MCD1645193.1 methyltransferase [Aurantimonas coralicida]